MMCESGMTDPVEGATLSIAISRAKRKFWIDEVTATSITCTSVSVHKLTATSITYCVIAFFKTTSTSRTCNFLTTVPVQASSVITGLITVRKGSRELKIYSIFLRNHKYYFKKKKYHKNPMHIAQGGV